jgi:hypothetical protein
MGPNQVRRGIKWENPDGFPLNGGCVFTPRSVLLREVTEGGANNCHS